MKVVTQLLFRFADIFTGPNNFLLELYQWLLSHDHKKISSSSDSEPNI